MHLGKRKQKNHQTLLIVPTRFNGYYERQSIYEVNSTSPLITSNNCRICYIFSASAICNKEQVNNQIIEWK